MASTTNYNIDKPKRGMGIVTSAIFHVVILILLFAVTFEGRMEPPIQELAITFEPEENIVQSPPVHLTPLTTDEAATGNNPENTDIAPASDIGKNLSRPSAPEKAHNAVNNNNAPSGTNGDVDRYEPVATDTEKVNPQALFQSTPTPTPDGIPTSGAPTHGDALFRGVENAPNAPGSNGGTSGGGMGGNSTSFSLSGRTVVGKMPLPDYDVNLQGNVVVDITVDQDGKVVSARAISKGSTVTNAVLWKAAEEAAKKTKFTPAPNVPVQYGTITYIFKLN